jgi:Cu/Ag efflux protein CusF
MRHSRFRVVRGVRPDVEPERIASKTAHCRNAMNRILAAAACATSAILPLLAAAAFAQAAIDGEVKKVDKPAGRITLQHAEIKQFDMPAMTGAYKVADPGMLDRVQPGDHVRFSLARLNSQYTITKLDVVR